MTGRHSFFAALALVGAALSITNACGSHEPAGALGGVSREPNAAIETGAAAPVEGGAATGDFRAGVAVVDVTPAVGVPLAGYTKRRRLIPDFDPANDIRYFGPSEGVRDPIQAKALVIESGGKRAYFVSLDTVAVLGDLVDRIVAAARAKGSAVTGEHLMAFASHTHSGPGALTSLGFWVQAATDELVIELRDTFVAKCADAIVAAEASLARARFGIGTGQLIGATKNRRVGVSKVFKTDDVDPELGVVRVDRPDGTPVATLYNYAIHGTALPAENLQLSADVMGAISRHVEKATGAPAIFANGAEADIAPRDEGEPALDTLGAIVGTKVVDVRSAIATRDRAKLRFSSSIVDFGEAKLKLRVDGLSSGAINLGAVATILGAGAGGAQTVTLDPTMVDHAFRVSAIAIDNDVISAVPGEAIHTLGLDIKAKGKALGFERVLVFGFANGYMSYVTDETEYEAGGYEAAATLFGPDTGKRLVDACVERIAAVGAQ